jgi:hypothetical protein
MPIIALKNTPQITANAMTNTAITVSIKQTPANVGKEKRYTHKKP